MSNTARNPRDVRMRGFASRTTVEDAWSWLDDAIQAKRSSLGTESIPIGNAAGRILASNVHSQVDVPMFDRAMMDGYALLAADTSGASNYNRLRVSVIGESFPNVPFDDTVATGTAVRIMTGSPMPKGADAVLPAERTESSDDSQSVELLGEVPSQKNIGFRGEDIKAGSTVLHAGRRLRPQDIGLLSSIGCADVTVVASIKVRVVVTGNELLPRGSVPTGYQIVDANGPMLSALVSRDGGVVVDDSIVPDNPTSIAEAMQDDVDVVLVSGGSSVGQEDHAPRLLAEHGELAIHGIAMRPSSPSGMGRLDGRLVFLLPGNPVSCLCSYDFFAGRAIRKLSGCQTDDRHWNYRSVRLPLARKIVSQVGRVDYARVAIDNEKIVPIAISGASMLSSTTRADGFVIVPADCEGYAPETEIEMFLYEG
ncbi:MAG: molybdopterin molybdotransferase MoeA [Planctomycetales bacterium]|nr:molybdopterin molybdotransferase MoeA [Planctomycetales bacterium]